MLQDPKMCHTFSFASVHFSEAYLGYRDVSQSNATIATTSTATLPVRGSAFGTYIPDDATRWWVHSAAVSAPTTTARSPPISTTPAL
jgi:hypothetical protein